MIGQMGQMLSSTRDEVGQLSDREKLLLLLASSGMSKRAMAEALGCSEQTVKNRLHDLYHEHGVGSLVGLLYKRGWITPPEDDDHSQPFRRRYP